MEEEQSNRFTAREVLEKDVNRKALTIGIGCMFFQQMAGINVIIFYLKHIFETSGSDFSPEVSTTIVGIIQVRTSNQYYYYYVKYIRRYQHLEPVPTDRIIKKTSIRKESINI